MANLQRLTNVNGWADDDFTDDEDNFIDDNFIDDSQRSTSNVGRFNDDTNLFVDGVVGERMEELLDTITSPPTNIGELNIMQDEVPIQTRVSRRNAPKVSTTPKVSTQLSPRSSGNVRRTAPKLTTGMTKTSGRAPKLSTPKIPSTTTSIPTTSILTTNVSPRTTGRNVIRRTAPVQSTEQVIANIQESRRSEEREQQTNRRRDVVSKRGGSTKRGRGGRVAPTKRSVSPRNVTMSGNPFEVRINDLQGWILPELDVTNVKREWTNRK